MEPINREQLRNILEDTIMHNRTHKHYKHVCDLAKQYKRFMTGDDQDELIVSYKPRETEAQKKQRVEITNSRTQYISNKVVSVFKRVPRSDSTVDNLYYEGSTEPAKDKEKIEEIQERFKNFHKGESLKDYLTDAFEYYSFYDPNAWLLIELRKDEKGGKPWIYPVEITSEQAVNYGWKGNELHFLIIKQGCQVIEQKKVDSHPDKKTDVGKFQLDERIQRVIDQHNQTATRQGEKFVLYAPDYALEYFEVAVRDKSIQAIDEITFAGYTFIDLKIGETIKRFAVKEYDTKSIICPAKQFGHLKDPSTNRETYVSELHPANKIYLDVINTKSEYDLTKALHGFLQKIQYAENCQYEETYMENDIRMMDCCMEGKLNISQKTCPACNGLGLKVHKTVQDIILKKWPDGKEEFIPLSEAIYYVQTPEHIVKMWKTELQDLERDVSFAIFNTNLFDRSEIAVTATEKRLNTEAAYDVLYDYGCQYSAFVKFITQMAAIHTMNHEQLVIDHKITNFQLETVYDYLTQRKMAVDAGSPYVIIQAFDMFTMSKQAQDGPINVEWMKARERWRPFREKTKEETMFILSDLPADNPKKVLYIYFEDIIDEIEQEHQDPPFAALPYKRQKEIITEKIALFTPEVPAPVMDPPEGDPDIPPIDENDDFAETAPRNGATKPAPAK